MTEFEKRMLEIEQEKAKYLKECTYQLAKIAYNVCEIALVVAPVKDRDSVSQREGGETRYLWPDEQVVDDQDSRGNVKPKKLRKREGSKSQMP